LKHFFPKRSAACVSQLRRAGSIIIGTTNLNEFASGITGINPHYGSSINPWNKDHISGGSSGGSCVSVSCGMVPFSLGTDTGGSIRVPSAYCGVVGIKPTYDLISRDGIINLAPSLDHVGCITRSAWDAALVLKILIQKDRLLHFPNVSNSGEDIIEEIGYKHEKLVVGIPHDYFFNDADPEIVRCFYKFVKVIESFGNQIKMVSIKGTNKIESSWTSIRLAEASEQHMRWIRGRASEYSEEVRMMIRNGLRISAVHYIHSCRLKNELRNNFLKSLKMADILVLPTTTVTAPKYSSLVRDNEESSKVRSALLRNNIPFNITGLPAVSIPVGFDRCRIPVGVQIIGKPYQEGTILSVAHAFEQQYNSLAKFIPPM
jgi:aspartyl-tRNA(Asn)/glutamyl-tRNA(Gln) amidotransferase subunit A